MVSQYRLVLLGATSIRTVAVRIRVLMRALLALLVLATACERMTMPAGPTPTPPISTPDPTSSSTRGEAPAFPAVSRPARIYVRVDSPDYPMHGSDRCHRVVCCASAGHRAQYASANFPCLRYPGTHEEANFHHVRLLRLDVDEDR